MSDEEAIYREALSLPNDGPLAPEEINQAYRLIVWRAFHGPVGYDLTFLAEARNRLLEGLAPLEGRPAENIRRGQGPFGAPHSLGPRPYLTGSEWAYLAQRLRRRMRRRGQLYPAR